MSEVVEDVEDVGLEGGEEEEEAEVEGEAAETEEAGDGEEAKPGRKRKAVDTDKTEMTVRKSSRIRNLLDTRKPNQTFAILNQTLQTFGYSKPNLANLCYSEPNQTFAIRTKPCKPLLF